MHSNYRGLAAQAGNLVSLKHNEIALQKHALVAKHETALPELALRQEWAHAQIHVQTFAEASVHVLRVPGTDYAEVLPRRLWCSIYTTPGNIMRALLGDADVGTTISHLPDLRAKQEQQLVSS